MRFRTVRFWQPRPLFFFFWQAFQSSPSVKFWLNVFAARTRSECIPRVFSCFRPHPRPCIHKNVFNHRFIHKRNVAGFSTISCSIHRLTCGMKGGRVKDFSDVGRSVTNHFLKYTVHFFNESNWSRIKFTCEIRKALTRYLLLMTLFEPRFQPVHPRHP